MTYIDYNSCSSNTDWYSRHFPFQHEHACLKGLPLFGIARGKGTETSLQKCCWHLRVRNNAVVAHFVSCNPQPGTLFTNVFVRKRPHTPQPHHDQTKQHNKSQEDDRLPINQEERILLEDPEVSGNLYSRQCTFWWSSKGIGTLFNFIDPTASFSPARDSGIGKEKEAAWMTETSAPYVNSCICTVPLPTTLLS